MTFKVTPSDSPSGKFSLSTALLCLFPAYLSSGLVASLLLYFGIPMLIGSVLAIAAPCLVCVQCYKGLTGWIRRREAQVRHAYEAQILAHHAGVEFNGGNTRLARADIHRMVITNAYNKTVLVPSSNVAVAGNAAMVGAVVAANALGNAMALAAEHKMRGLARISYLLSVEAGGKAYIIAGGLTEVCAFGLMTDIDRALNA